MAAHIVYDTVLDQNGQPIAAALVTIRDADGTLVDTGGANPLVTDATGLWTATLDNGTYYLVISKGDDFISRTLTVCATDETAIRGAFYPAQFTFYQSQEYRQPEHVFNDNDQVAVDRGTNSQTTHIFSTCTIA